MNDQSQQQGITDRARRESVLQRWPRSVWWAIWAAGLLVLYFAIVEPIFNLAGSLNIKADRIADAARAGDAPLRQASALLRAIDVNANANATDLASAMRLAEARLGPAVVLGDHIDRPTAFDREVKDIISRHDLQDVMLSGSSLQSLDSDLPPGIIGPRHQLKRLVLEVDFTGTPTTVSEVLAALQRSPLVTAVAKVQITRVPNSTLVKCTMTPETWIKAPTTTRR